MKHLSLMSADEIRDAVAARYDQVAHTPEAQFGFPVGKEFATKLGYPSDVLAEFPDSAIESFTGAGNPHGHVRPRPGETVLDLGCGAGLDLCIYAKQVTEAGRVIGVDHSTQMIAKAMHNAESLGMAWAEFICSGVERIPVDSGEVDVVTANGILNLSPDKDNVLIETARVLRPGGRMIFSEIVLTEAIAEVSRDSIDDWFRCIGGAETIENLLSRFRRCGFATAEALALTRNARTGHKNSRSATICATTPN
jgi:arsenite methyltransferase